MKGKAFKKRAARRKARQNGWTKTYKSFKKDSVGHAGGRSGFSSYGD